MIDDLNVNQQHAGKDKRQGARYKGQGMATSYNWQWAIDKYSNNGAIKQ